VNKQPFRIWYEEQAAKLQELPMRPEKCSVWCGLWDSGIIGPYFFKGNEGNNVPLNGDRYRSVIVH